MCRHEAVRGGDAGPDTGQGSAGARRTALRHLRLRPARARALRRAGRGDGGARLRRVHADHVGHRDGSRVRRRGARTRPGGAPRVPRGRACRLVPAGPPRQGRAPDRALAAGAGRVRRAGAGRAVDVVRGPQRAVARRRGAHRADGGGAARGQQVLGLAPRRRDRAGLRPGRPRGDLLAQGPRRAHDRGLGLVGRPTRARRAAAARTSWSTRPRTRRTPSPGPST